MRGRQSEPVRVRKRGGTTPAHAGKTGTPLYFMWQTRDHPRACGEDGLLHTGQRHQAGPPPRMRGRLTLAVRNGADVGTTPAHAGKTGFVVVALGAEGDHPRACGEDMRLCRNSRLCRGPPPRMRGRQVFMGVRITRTGTTPAHAGKTLADL